MNRKNNRQSASWFFEKIKKIGKLLARLIMKKWKKTQMTRIRNERDITPNLKEIKDS